MRELLSLARPMVYGRYPCESRVECGFTVMVYGGKRHCEMSVEFFPAKCIALYSNVCFSNKLSRQLCQQFGIKEWPSESMLLEVMCLCPQKDAQDVAEIAASREQLLPWRYEWIASCAAEAGSVQNSSFLESLLVQKYEDIAAACGDFVQKKSHAGAFTRVKELAEVCRFLATMQKNGNLQALQARCTQDPDELCGGLASAAFHFTCSLPIMNCEQASTAIEIQCDLPEPEYYRELVGKARQDAHTKAGSEKDLAEVSKTIINKDVSLDPFLWDASCLIIAELLIEHYRPELERQLREGVDRIIIPKKWVPKRSAFRKLWLKRFPPPQSQREILSTLDNICVRFNKGSESSKHVGKFLRMLKMEWIEAKQFQQKTGS